MDACFTLMIQLNNSARIPFAAVRLEGPVINWISGNNTKPGRPKAPALVVNSASLWVESNVDRPLDSLWHEMLEALDHYVVLDPLESRRLRHPPLAICECATA
jgi:renalase